MAKAKAKAAKAKSRKRKPTAATALSKSTTDGREYCRRCGRYVLQSGETIVVSPLGPAGECEGCGQPLPPPEPKVGHVGPGAEVVFRQERADSAVGDGWSYRVLETVNLFGLPIGVPFFRTVFIY